jgi:hypothetical protein
MRSGGLQPPLNNPEINERRGGWKLPLRRLAAVSPSEDWLSDHPSGHLGRICARIIDDD